MPQGLSELIIANFISVLALTTIFYLFHPRKYDTMLIFVVGNMIGLIVRYFVELEIGVGTGFGLFAIFSLMHFRENYHTFTMLYLFVALSFGLLSSLMQVSDLQVFIIFVIATLALLLIFEKFLGGVKKTTYQISLSELPDLENRAKKDLDTKSVRDLNVQSISGDTAKVTVTYKK